MKKTGIFFGSTTGNTEAMASRIAAMLNIPEQDIHDVAESAPSLLGNYDNLIFGIPTWGAGDLQEDWADYIDGIAALDLSGKKIALFGLGDTSFTDTFCNAVGELYDRLAETGATFVGAFDTAGYEYSHSAADRDGKAVGLLIDDVNYSNLTDFRLEQWVGIIADEFNSIDS